MILIISSYLEVHLSHILVILFEDENQVLSVLKLLKNPEHQEMLNLDDAAVIIEDTEGKVQVKNMAERNVKAWAGIGGLVGLALGSILFPVAGIAIGAASGALIGKSR